jgi:hypothetical protein
MLLNSHARGALERIPGVLFSGMLRFPSTCHGGLGQGGGGAINFKEFQRHLPIAFC